MDPYFERMEASKKAFRNELMLLPIEEKIRILEELNVRAREIEIARNDLRKKNAEKAVKRPPTELI